VEVSGPTETAVINQSYGGALKLGTSSTLTATEVTSTITIPDTDGFVPNIRVDAGKTMTLTGDSGLTSFNTAKLSGQGTLVLTDTFTGSVRIGGGDGNVTFNNPVTTAASAAGVLALGNTGKTTFTGAVALNGATGAPGTAHKISGDVIFKAGVTLGVTVTSLSLGGNVTLFNSASGSDAFGIAIKEDSSVILAEGKSISVGGIYSDTSTTGIAAPLVKILTAVETARITASTDAKLLAPFRVASKVNTRTRDAVQMLVLDGSVAIASGTLKVEKVETSAEGSDTGVTGFIIADGAQIITTDIPEDIRGSLVFANGAIVNLAADESLQTSVGITTAEGGGDNYGGLIFLGPNGQNESGAVIGTYASATTLTVSGGDVTLKEDAISGNQATITTVGTTGGFNTRGNLALDGVTVNVATSGLLAFGHIGATVQLNNRGGLIFTGATDGAPKEGNNVIKTSAGNATVSGAAAVNSSGTKNALVSVIHDGSNVAAYIQAEDAITLSKSGATVGAN
jgi:hypothetical protein